ncbi:hypothetical protein Pcinc_025835 [Petrolisthes cinctipes]|uniref:Reverse transcriptase n=1 Tax=Petrolisthes cinctipes TaxID=88211 RepID=A0AAE1F7P3_PETCI|nr:hypothetical protein Pcinc_025835 [Petrolisthes cinctipes]
MLGADGGTDHRLVRTKLNLKIRPAVRRCAPPAHLNIRALQGANTLSTFKAELESGLTTDTNGLSTTEDLTRAWDNAYAGIPINYRLDGNLFNLRRLQAKTKVRRENVIDPQYADEAAYVSCSLEHLQDTLNLLADSHRHAGLIINTTKTEVLAMRDPPQVPVTFRIDYQYLKNVPHFPYLGSILTETCDITNEVHRRIGLSSASFGSLSE